MNGAVRMLLSPLAGFAAYGLVQFVSDAAAWACGAAVMLALALLPGSRPHPVHD